MARCASPVRTLCIARRVAEQQQPSTPPSPLCHAPPCMPHPAVATWDAYATLSTLVSGAGRPDGVHRGAGWFAALSHAPSAELNLCGLDPRATADGAAELVAALGPDLPAVVFTSAAPPGGRAGRAAGGGVRDGERAGAADALRPPATARRDGRLPRRARRDRAGGRRRPRADRGGAPHRPRPRRRHHRGGRDEGIAQPWLAWDGEEPVSTVWLVAHDGFVGVREMMTPLRHQRRGAGRSLLATALAATWTPATEHAVLLATPAGTRLYASLGFDVADDVVTCYRGLEDDVKAAIGQAP